MEGFRKLTPSELGQRIPQLLQKAGLDLDVLFQILNDTNQLERLRHGLDPARTLSPKNVIATVNAIKSNPEIHLRFIDCVFRYCNTMSRKEKETEKESKDKRIATPTETKKACASLMGHIEKLIDGLENMPLGIQRQLSPRDEFVSDVHKDPSDSKPTKEILVVENVDVLQHKLKRLTTELRSLNGALAEVKKRADDSAASKKPRQALANNLLGIVKDIDLPVTHILLIAKAIERWRTGKNPVTSFCEDECNIAIGWKKPKK